MFWRLLLLEKDKVAGRLLLWIELGIMAFIIVAIDLLYYFTSKLAPIQGRAIYTKPLEWPTSLIATVNIATAHSLGGILLVIMIAVVTAREYSWRTFHLWLSRGVSRLALMGAKSIIIIALAILLVITSVVVGAIMTAIVTLALHGSLQLVSGDLQHLVLSFLITDLGLLPYAALALMLTILFRNAIVSIGVGLVLLLLVERAAYAILISVNQTTEQIAQYLPVALEGSLQNAASGAGIPSGGHVLFLSPLLCCIYMFVYVAIFAGIGIWQFTRQNFTD